MASAGQSSDANVFSMSNLFQIIHNIGEIAQVANSIESGLAASIVRPDLPFDASIASSSVVRPPPEVEKVETSPRQQERDIFCAFCRRNGEIASIYRSHQLKDAQGIVRCPFLRRHRCELCQATGDFAHTRSHCPLAEAGRILYPLESKYHNAAEMNDSGRNKVKRKRRRRRKAR